MEQNSASRPNMEPEALAARNRRNWWMAGGLLAFVLLMGIGTAIRLAQGAGVDPCEASLYWDHRSNSCGETPAEPILENEVPS